MPWSYNPPSTSRKWFQLTHQGIVWPCVTGFGGMANYFRVILGSRVVAVAMGEPEQNLECASLRDLKWQIFVVGPQDDVFVQASSLIATLLIICVLHRYLQPGALMWGLAAEDCLTLVGNFYSSATLAQTYFANTFHDGYPWLSFEEHPLALLLRLALRIMDGGVDSLSERICLC